MTRRNFIHLLLGLMFCLCFFSKQAAPNFDLVIEPASIQAVVAENADVDDVVESADDLILLPFLFAAAFIFFVVPSYAIPRYSQPLVPTPQRPPSF